MDSNYLGKAREVLAKYKDDLMDIPGVFGVGVSGTKEKPVFLVMILKSTPSESSDQIPDELEGYSVVVEKQQDIPRAL